MQNEKFEFSKQKFKFLGYIISENGIEADPKKKNKKQDKTSIHTTFSSRRSPTCNVISTGKVHPRFSQYKLAPPPTPNERYGINYMRKPFKRLRRNSPVTMSIILVKRVS